MERLRTVVTSNSVWKFDLDLSRYVRFPRQEAPDAFASIPYTAEWEQYTHLQRFGPRILVHRPVPWGEGAMRMTGHVEWDDLEPEELG